MINQRSQVPLVNDWHYHSTVIIFFWKLTEIFPYCWIFLVQWESCLSQVRLLLWKMNWINSTGQKAQKSRCHSCLCRTQFSVSLCHSPLPPLEVSALRAPYTAHPHRCQLFSSWSTAELHTDCTTAISASVRLETCGFCFGSIFAWQEVRKCKRSDLQAWVFKQDLVACSFHELNVTKQKLCVLSFVFCFVFQLNITTDAGIYPSNLNLA